MNRVDIPREPPRPDPAHDAQAEPPEPPRPDPRPSPLAALGEVGSALRDALHSWGRLAASEARLARANLPFMIGSVVALVFFVVSLWVVLVVLAGWGLYLLTASVTWALVALATGHLVLMALMWLGLRHLLHQASMPHSRAQLRVLWATVQRQTAAGSAPPPSTTAAPAAQNTHTNPTTTAQTPKRSRS